MRKTFKAVAVCALAAAVLVSCGGKGGSESNTASTTANTPIATATPGPTPVPKPDIMAPEDAVISIGDYKNITFDAYKSEMTEEDAKEYYSEQVAQSIAAGQTGFETLEDRVRDCTYHEDAYDYIQSYYIEITIDNPDAIDYSFFEWDRTE